jgi:flavin-dependent dehydrogenase
LVTDSLATGEVSMSEAPRERLRIAVIGGGPAGSFFALSALTLARAAGRDLDLVIYEGKDFRRFGQPGCNMCAGIVPAWVVEQLGELGLAVPPELIWGRVGSYCLHTTAGILRAAQPDPHAEILSVYRGSGPRYGHPPGMRSFDEFLVEEAVARGATLRRGVVQAVRRGARPEVATAEGAESYDLVVLATGVNHPGPRLDGFAYLPPPTGPTCQTELYLGHAEVELRLGSAVHVFLPPDSIGDYGVLIPKGPFVTASLLGPRHQMRSLRAFLARPEVTDLLGRDCRQVCGCLPRISLGPARHVVDDGFVAIGDASSTRLYKNGIGSALATARQAAWTTVHAGTSREAYAHHYLPLCRHIDSDNRLGRLLFRGVPLLKRTSALARAQREIAESGRRVAPASELQARLLWGMFTGAYPYRDLLGIAVSPHLTIRLALAAGRSFLRRGVAAGPALA